jgi:phosphomannomutase
MTAFKAYDIIDRVPDELNEDIAYRIGRAYAREPVVRINADYVR